MIFSLFDGRQKGREKYRYPLSVYNIACREIEIFLSF
jgi:hypothetical protein